MKSTVPRFPARPSFPVFALAAALALAPCGRSAAASPPAVPQWHFEFSDAGGAPDKLVWQGEAGLSYDLWRSDDLSGWTHVDGFPQDGAGAPMEHAFAPGRHGYFKIEVTEKGGPVHDDFVLIPSGSFQMGDTFGEGDADELPVHDVYVSGFHMGKYEVTKALWDEVRTWGANNGYTDLPAGEGKAEDHPVHSITWYAMVKWCNARSEKAGLSPCYRVGGEIYRTGGSDAVVCDWSVGGYRLPTEAEWVKAARGGLSGKRFPWGDTISHSQANYKSDSRYSYDVSPTRGYHPDWDEGWKPYTSPVGTFAPNGYGLYDMSGNVYELCWDWYGSYSSGSQTDPRGPASGAYRVDRGGSWGGNALHCRAANRYRINPALTYDSLGFRVVRSSVP